MRPLLLTCLAVSAAGPHASAQRPKLATIVGIVADTNNNKIDNKSVGDFTFNMNANQTIQVPFKIDDISDGLHDILIAIVIDPYNKSLDPKFRVNTLSKNIS